jgi:hypothetical protein
MDFIILIALFSGCILFGFLPLRRQGQRRFARFYLLCLSAALLAGLLVSAHLRLPNPMTPFLVLAQRLHLIN